METVLWLLVLFVVVFFANLARRNAMIKKLKASGQLANDEADPVVKAEAEPQDTRRDS